MSAAPTPTWRASGSSVAPSCKEIVPGLWNCWASWPAGATQANRCVGPGGDLSSVRYFHLGGCLAPSGHFHPNTYLSGHLDLGRHFCSGRYLGPDRHLDPSGHLCPGGYNGPVGISTCIGTLAQKGMLTWVGGGLLDQVGYLDLAGYLHPTRCCNVCGKTQPGWSSQPYRSLSPGGHLGYPGLAGHFV